MHAMVSRWHAPASPQVWPSEQSTQVPLLHVAATPQEEPFMALPTGEQVGPASVQSVTPVWQMAGAQGIPETHVDVPSAGASPPGSPSWPESMLEEMSGRTSKGASFGPASRSGALPSKPDVPADPAVPVAPAVPPSDGRRASSSIPSTPLQAKVTLNAQKEMKTKPDRAARFMEGSPRDEHQAKRRSGPDAFVRTLHRYPK
jgi:hypothetical protein